MSEMPETIGKYKVTAIIAKGGMGTVYKAIHPSLRRYVVIKKLTIRGNVALRERFKREAQILMELHHANIVHMFDFFKEGAFYYIVLEYVDGMALDKLLKKRGKLTNYITMLIFRDTCLALKYAHEKGIIHRDIKPGNILISRHGEVKLADFGIASSEKEKEKETESDLTQEGSALGTPSYMPPEQFSDSKTVDKRADIYALGIMLYEMVTGKKPFPGNFSAETIAQIHKGKYESPKKLDKNIDPLILHLIKKMIQPNPKKRYQDVSKIIPSVDRYLDRYDCDQLRGILTQELIKDKNYKEGEIKNKKSFFKIALWGLAGATFIFCCCLLWNSGLIHKSILRHWFTPVQINLTLPASARGNADLPIRAFFFENDKTSIPEVKNTRRTFISDSKNGKNKNTTYSTKPVYLTHGKYRVKVVTGSYVWWQTIKVDDKEKVLNLNFLKYAKRQIAVHATSYDSITNHEITDKTEFTFLNNNAKWVHAKDLSPNEFINGRVWSVKAVCPGYKAETFELKIEWYQDELYLSAILEPNQK